MKRKRGHKKGKHKESRVANAVNVNVNADDDSVLEDQDIADLDSEMEVQATDTIESDELAELTNTHADELAEKGSGQGHVKVKLKSTKMLEPQNAHSDALAQSDTDRSSSHLSLGKQKVNDGGNLLVETQPIVSKTFSRKTGNIKIKSSRGIGSFSIPSGSLQGQGDQTLQSTSDVHKTARKSHIKEQQVFHQDTGYSEKGLNTALVVIKKIMKMDAAEPFNVPVNPVALGIPDYFDIIETPMDFGTICKNLEEGHTYKNSEDVYKDVQYIWENCYKYNNKGDYIVDLMKRVKKNFMKYWTAAGLYSSQQSKSNASEKLPGETTVTSNQEKMHVKGTHSKLKKRGRHGFNKHKSDCLCAVCVVRRKRKEREGNVKVDETRIEISDGNISQELKQEETSTENHCSEDASSNGNSPNSLYRDADGDMMEEQSEKIKLEGPEKQSSSGQKNNEEAESQKTSSDQFQLGGEGANPESRSEEMEDSGTMIREHNSKDDIPPHQSDEAIEIQKLQQKHDSLMMQQHTISCENLLERNPSILKLCGSLFSNNHKSVWNGPHTLGHHNAPVPNRSRAIHAAIEMFMK